MYLQLDYHGKTLFEGLSTLPVEISNDCGDLIIGSSDLSSVAPKDGHAKVFLKLYREEFIKVGLLHRDGVAADLLEIAELISAGAALRRVRDRLNHWRRFWNLTDDEIRDFLQHVESPLEILKREMAAQEHLPERILAFNRKPAGL